MFVVERREVGCETWEEMFNIKDEIKGKVGIIMDALVYKIHIKGKDYEWRIREIEVAEKVL